MPTYKSVRDSEKQLCFLLVGVLTSKLLGEGRVNGFEDRTIKVGYFLLALSNRFAANTLNGTLESVAVARWQEDDFDESSIDCDGSGHSGNGGRN